MDCSLPGSCGWDFLGENTGSIQLPFPSPEDLSDPGIQPESLVFPALAGGFLTTESPEGLGGTRIQVNKVNHLKHNESSTKGVVGDAEEEAFEKCVRV